MSFDYGNPSDITWVVPREVVNGLPYVREFLTARVLSGAVPVQEGRQLLAYQWDATTLRVWDIDHTHDPHRPRTCFGLLVDPRGIEKHIPSPRWQRRRIGWRARRWILKRRGRPAWEIRLR